MSRHRYIASDMGADEKIEALATTAGMQAVALYMLLIPNLDDWGRMDGRVREIKYRVVPALPYSVTDIDAALSAMQEVGLLVRYEVDGHPYLAVDQGAFFRHQTYLKKDRRERDESRIPSPDHPRAIIAQIAHSAESAHSAQIAQIAPLFPFPSPSSSSSPSVGADAPVAPDTHEGSQEPEHTDVIPPDQQVIGAFIQDFEQVVGRKARANERGVIGKYAKSSPDRLTEAMSDLRGVLAKGGAVREPLPYLARLMSPRSGDARASTQARPVRSRYLTPNELGLMPPEPASTGPPRPPSLVTAKATGGRSDGDGS